MVEEGTQARRKSPFSLSDYFAHRGITIQRKAVIMADVISIFPIRELT
jgi:hypothetical protein